jgi:exopolysaccharide biosynthesis predicted pyruvyltransferase EpsI
MADMKPDPSDLIEKISSEHNTGSLNLGDYDENARVRKATDEFILTVPGEFTMDNQAGSLKITRTTCCGHSKHCQPDNSETGIFNEVDIANFLLRYSNQEIVYCANPGNAGDAIIAFATYRLFNQLKIKYRIIRHTEQVFGQVIFYSGGGNLVEGKYESAYRFIENNYRQNAEIVVLPHTVFGYNHLLSSVTNVTILCRERVSYSGLLNSGFPKNRLFLAHDMAFLLSGCDFQAYQRPGAGTAFVLRTDSEGLASLQRPTSNLDISLSWNGELWHRPDFAENVTLSLACYLSGFETIVTDRLHIGILAALLNRKVLLYPNNYYKISAVYEYSIRNRFSHVVFFNTDILNYNTVEEQKISQNTNRPDPATLWLQQRDQTLNRLKETEGLLNQVMNSRSWKITAPLREFASFLKSKS